MRGGVVGVGAERRRWGRLWVAAREPERRSGRGRPSAVLVRVLSKASCALGAGKWTYSGIGAICCCGTCSWPDRFLVGGYARRVSFWWGERGDWRGGRSFALAGGRSS